MRDNEGGLGKQTLPAFHCKYCSDWLMPIPTLASNLDTRFRDVLVIVDHE